MLCAEESVALLKGGLNNSFSSVITPGSPTAVGRGGPRRCASWGVEKADGLQGLVIENIKKFAVEIAVGLHRGPIVFLGIGKAG